MLGSLFLLIMLGMGLWLLFLDLLRAKAATHAMEHLVAMLGVTAFVGSIFSDHLVQRWGTAKQLQSLRLARQLHDPFAVLMVPCVLLFHDHSTAELSLTVHRLWAFVGFSLVGAMCANTIVHAAFPIRSEMTRLSWAFCAYFGILMGLWLAVMGFWMYVWEDDSSHGVTGRYMRSRGPPLCYGNGDRSGIGELFWVVTGVRRPTGLHEGLSIFAVTMWLSGLVLAAAVHDRFDRRRGEIIASANAVDSTLHRNGRNNHEDTEEASSSSPVATCSHSASDRHQPYAE
jgi:hypothetical protein